MNNGIIGDFGAPNPKELEKINEFTRRKFSAEEVYAFSVVLCDNDVDRDYERFTDEALIKMAELFVGKTGIFDHSHKAENQCARIFSCTVEEVEGKFNAAGGRYKHLKARAYMPKSEKTAELILEIDAGIKKEVSVGCSMKKSGCSICGQSAGTCNHKKGKIYRKNGKNTLCYFDLFEPYDAYEWSFVAVPAQPKAGVVKSFCESKEIRIGEIIKSLSNGEVSLSAVEAAALSAKFDELKAESLKAGEFIGRKKLEIIEAFIPTADDAATAVFMKALDRLETDELYKLYNIGIATKEISKPQLAVKKNSKQDNKHNNVFIV